MLSPVGRELAELRGLVVPPSRKSSPELEELTHVDERFEAIRRKLLTVQELVAELAGVGESDAQEPQRELDLAEVVRVEVRALEARASRAGVAVLVRVAPEDARAAVRAAPRAASVIVRELLAHAILATPRGSAVAVTVTAAQAGNGLGARLVVDDGGTILPAAARRALLALEVEPGTFGRPSSVALFVAAEFASAQGALLEIADAPVEDGRGGGVRVSVTFPR
jgi:signal transduction histidine kinase